MSSTESGVEVQRRRRVSLCLVNLKSEGYPVRSTPLALVTLGGYVRRRFGHFVRVDYVDLQHDDLERDLLVPFESDPPGIIGISAQFGSHEQLYRVLTGLGPIVERAAVSVIVGNVVPTYGWADILAAFPFVICCIGRGEFALAGLVDQHVHGARVDPTALSNCAITTDEGVRVMPEQAVSFAGSGSGDWAGLFRRYPPAVYEEVWIEASRGCPQKKGGVGCRYCAILPNAGSQDWQERPRGLVLDELATLAAAGVRHVRFADEEFAADQPVRAHDFATELQRLRAEIEREGIRWPTFDVAIRVDDVARSSPRAEIEQTWSLSAGMMVATPNEVRTAALVELQRAGLRQVYLGVESGSKVQLRRMNKGVRPQDNERAIAELRRLSLQAACGWIMIDPLMTDLGELGENVAFLERNRLIPSRPSDDFATNPISRMRILEGSPMVDVMHHHDLLTGRLPNLVEHAFRYASAEIAVIVDALDNWDRGLPRDQIYSLKNRVAHTALDESLGTDPAEALFLRLKQWDFELIRALAAYASAAGAAFDPATVDRLRSTLDAERRRDIERTAPGVLELTFGS
jgi:radical SAM superfamily enzyme YgiQ (UPF0313 family)